MSLRQAARRLLGRGLRGALFAASGRRRAEQVRILLYHSVDDSGSTLSVSGSQLRTHLELLKSEGFRTLSTAAYLERLSDARRGQHECLITFDDGYENFYDVAAPIFLEFDFRATVFLPTDFIGDYPWWFERDRSVIAQFLGDFGFSSTEMASLDAMMRETSGQRLMSKAQIKELSQAGFDFQSHSSGHHFLPSLSGEALQRDLMRSQHVLAEEFGGTSALLCYPYGAYNQHVADVARRLGFQAAVLAEYVGPGGGEFELGRVPVSGELGSSYLRFAMSPALDRYTRWMGRRRARGYRESQGGHS